MRRRSLGLVAIVCALLLVSAAGCESPPPEPEICTNLVDDDGDGDIDCLDEDCGWRVNCRDAVLSTDDLEEHYYASQLPWDRIEGDRVAFWSARRRWGGDLDGDGLLDLGADLHYIREWDSEESVGVGGSWLALAFSSQLDGGDVDLAAAPVQISDSLPGVYSQRSTTGCDVDGDGFDDLARLQRYGSWYDHEAPGPRELTIVFGGPADAPPRVFRIAANGQPTNAHVEFVDLICAGDLDGDGQDELLFETGTVATHSWFAVLDWELLAAATSDLVEGIAILWPSSTSVIGAAGDLDGDGYDDLLMAGYCYGGATLSYEDSWFVGVVIPGGEHLAAPRATSSYMSEELRPPVELQVALPGPPWDLAETYCPTVALGDLDGDGTPELAVAQPNGMVQIFAHPDLGGLDGSVELGAGDVVGTIGDRYGTEPSIETYPRVAPLSIEDFDGDGRGDLALAQTLNPVLGLESTVGAWQEGIGIMLNPTFGALEGEHIGAEVDLFIEGAFDGVRLDGDRDQDGLPEVVLYSLSGSVPTQAERPVNFVSVLSGRALQAAAGDP